MPDFSCADADAVIIVNAIIAKIFFIVFYYLSMIRYFEVLRSREFFQFL